MRASLGALGSALGIVFARWWVHCSACRPDPETGLAVLSMLATVAFAACALPACERCGRIR